MEYAFSRITFLAFYSDKEEAGEKGMGCKPPHPFSRITAARALAQAAMYLQSP